MRKRGLCCRSVSVRPSVRLSLRPSVTLVDSIHTAENIVKLLSPPGNPIILVFLTPSVDTQIQVEHNTRGWENLSNFEKNRRCLEKATI